MPRYKPSDTDGRILRAAMKWFHAWNSSHQNNPPTVNNSIETWEIELYRACQKAAQRSRQDREAA